jgi:hypothetical protein
MLTLRCEQDNQNNQDRQTTKHTYNRGNVLAVSKSFIPNKLPVDHRFKQQASTARMDNTRDQ